METLISLPLCYYYNKTSNTFSFKTHGEEIKEDDLCIICKVKSDDYDADIEYDGIGDYEFWGASGYDKGEPMVEDLHVYSVDFYEAYGSNCFFEDVLRMSGITELQFKDDFLKALKNEHTLKYDCGGVERETSNYADIFDESEVDPYLFVDEKDEDDSFDD